MDNLAFRAGLEGAFVNRDVNFDKLTFGDQFDQTGFLDIPTAEVFNTGLKVNYVNFAAGGLLYTPNFFLGFSAHNLSTPNQSFLDGESLLPVKLSFHAGLKIPFGASNSGRGLAPSIREKSITPTIQYKAQGQFDQLDVGASVTLYPLVLGLYYRGLPVKSFESYTNNESAIFVVGLSKDNLNLGYSYDHTLSELRGISGGAHEISVSYVFSLRDPRRPSKDVMRIPCPKF
jgi:type IX secretion system PorP/SprF family membrane protein